MDRFVLSVCDYIDMSFMSTLLIYLARHRNKYAHACLVPRRRSLVDRGARGVVGLLQREMSLSHEAPRSLFQRRLISFLAYAHLVKFQFKFLHMQTYSNKLLAFQNYLGKTDQETLIQLYSCWWKCSETRTFWETVNCVFIAN